MIHTGLPPSYLPSVPWGPLLPLYTSVNMLKGGAHAARRIHFKPCLSWWWERLFGGFQTPTNEGFFFREEHHASQPVLGWFYFSKITDMDFDRKNSEMQRCCDLLNATKVFNGRIQTRPGGHQRPLPNVQEHSLSEWGSGITGYLPGPAVHTGLGGASLDSGWSYNWRTWTRTELSWCVFFCCCLACRLFVLTHCQRESIIQRY